MTDRDALEQEMSLAIGDADPYRHASDTCAEVALRHIAAARAKALAERDAERKHLINVAYSWWGMGLVEMVHAMRRLPIGADVEQAP